VNQEDALAVLTEQPPADFSKAEDFVLMDHRA